MTANHPDQTDMQSMWTSREAATAWREGQAARARLFGPATEKMLDLANIGPGSRVLDIATGTGDQALMAAARVGPFGSVLATDIAESMVAVAADVVREAGLANVATAVLDGHHIDLEADMFDAVISRNGLMFLHNLPEALAGIRRVLKPGGRLAAAPRQALEERGVCLLGDPSQLRNLVGLKLDGKHTSDHHILLRMTLWPSCRLLVRESLFGPCRGAQGFEMLCRDVRNHLALPVQKEYVPS